MLTASAASLATISALGETSWRRDILSGVRWLECSSSLKSLTVDEEWARSEGEGEDLKNLGANSVKMT